MWHEFQDVDCTISGTNHWPKRTKKTEKSTRARPATTMGFSKKNDFENGLSGTQEESERDMQVTASEDGGLLASVQTGKAKGTLSFHRRRLMNSLGFDEKFRNEQLSLYEKKMVIGVVWWCYLGCGHVVESLGLGPFLMLRRGNFSQKKKLGGGAGCSLADFVWITECVNKDQVAKNGFSILDRFFGLFLKFSDLLQECGFY